MAHRAPGLFTRSGRCTLQSVGHATQPARTSRLAEYCWAAARLELQHPRWLRCLQ